SGQAEEGGDDVNHHAPYDLATHVLHDVQRKRARGEAKPIKSSQFGCSLQLDYMKWNR
ncbi:hypothetical protein CLORAM_00001, partial [Thomasclavelia ramosa DSM 1402]